MKTNTSNLITSNILGLLRLIILALILIISGCDDDTDITDSSDKTAEETAADEDAGRTDDGEESFSDVSSGGDGGIGNDQGGMSGVVTAGEWNDLDHWDFWFELINGQDFGDKSTYWGFYTQNRIAIEVKDGETPVSNIILEIKKDDISIWKTMTDNLGRGELWIDLYQSAETINITAYDLYVGAQKSNMELKLASEGINSISINSSASNSNRVELCFIVDATGSMSDELEFLKDDLEDVIEKIENSDSQLDIYTSSVFYRDEGDEYVVRKSDFTGDLNQTKSFIDAQSAGGGGNYPEAVHTALDMAMNQLQWTSGSRTKISFLLLDAPPHYTSPVIADIQSNVMKAAEEGIKLIPISASGVDKNTEFLMRFMAMATNGTYVFITDDSGVGGEHIEPSIGEYQVEILNDLMVRLVTKYAE